MGEHLSVCNNETRVNGIFLHPWGRIVSLASAYPELKQNLRRAFVLYCKCDLWICLVSRLVIADTLNHCRFIALHCLGIIYCAIEYITSDVMVLLCARRNLKGT